MERMKIRRFSENNLNLLMEISRKGKITSKGQETYAPFAFYLNIKELEKYGLVVCNGIDNRRRKEWCLTEKGFSFVKHLNIIEEVLS